jgi:hypothetical protein
MAPNNVFYVYAALSTINTGREQEKAKVLNAPLLFTLPAYPPGVAADPARMPPSMVSSDPVI